MRDFSTSDGWPRTMIIHVTAYSKATAFQPPMTCTRLRAQTRRAVSSCPWRSMFPVTRAPAPKTPKPLFGPLKHKTRRDYWAGGRYGQVELVQSFHCLQHLPGNSNKGTRQDGQLRISRQCKHIGWPRKQKIEAFVSGNVRCPRGLGPQGFEHVGTRAWTSWRCRASAANMDAIKA